MTIPQLQLFRYVKEGIHATTRQWVAHDKFYLKKKKKIHPFCVAYAFLFKVECWFLIKLQQ